jgi:hypothetical protein
MKNYDDAFAAVPGCRVLWYKTYGDYGSGEFLAKIEYKGEILYIHDWFGSCSGCDSFMAEFEDIYPDIPGYLEKLAEFGKPYVESALPLEQMLFELKERQRNKVNTEELSEMISDLERESAPIDSVDISHLSLPHKILIRKLTNTKLSTEVLDKLLTFIK